MNEKVLRIVMFFIVILTSGCTATGQKFSGVSAVQSAECTAYVFRRSKFVGAAYCPAIWIDEREVGCLKNSGFFRLGLMAGAHTLTKHTRPLEATRDQHIRFNCKRDDILYFEWSTDSVGSAGVYMAFSDEFIQHSDKTALPLLNEMREQTSE
ncbi:MAG: hypothetical protein COB04_16920 [Gammaproteobacteria bacterium]|nr:MAG: hypothetical protein COB04_16920 [Gammaproteobacteria bacterium]